MSVHIDHDGHCPTKPSGGFTFNSLIDRPNVVYDAVDRNATRLHCFGHFAGQINIQRAILQRGTGDLDVLVQLEALLEITRGNPTMQERAWRLFVRFSTDNFQRRLFDLDLQLGPLKAGNGYRDPILIIAYQLDVIWRIRRMAVREGSFINDLGKPVKADGGTTQGAKVKTDGYIFRKK